MEKNDWLLISYIFLILGAFAIVGAIICYSYYEQVWNWRVYPLRDNAGLLLVVWVICLVFGGAFLWRANQEVKA